MKQFKYFFLTLMIVMTGLSVKAATAEEVENYKASVMSYLKMEGYFPKIDSDGDISFKHDGSTYWVQITSYDDGYYVIVMTMTNIEGKSINTVYRSINEVSRGLKYVKQTLSANEKIVTTEYDWYCISINDFKRMFSTALNVVAAADTRFINAVNQ